MRKFSFFVGNIIRILRKHSFLATLMVILMTLSLVLLCTTFYHNNKIEENVQNFDETFGNKTYYFMYESFGDFEYYKYLDDDNSGDFKNLLKFNKLLHSEENFNFISLNSQYVEVHGIKVPDIFLYSYEEGYSEDSVYQRDEKTYYCAKAIQVSQSFFGEFDINISKGRSFDKADYNYSNNRNIPVLLGSAYKDILSVGDTFSCEYLFEDVVCEVIGFVDENSYFFENNDNNFISCERYIIMPAMYSETDSPTYFNKLMLLHHNNITQNPITM